MDVRIRKLHTLDEMTQLVELNKIVWRLDDYEDCIPNHVLLAVGEHGGLILGAYHKDAMIGFSMVILAHSKTEGLYHHSHILGVHPEWAHKNVGYRLKKAHYDCARAEGIKRITWTYDPLLGANANLNITKLGGIVREYRRDMYGEVMGHSNLVSGLPSDRFLLEWRIDTKRVMSRMKTRPAMMQKRKIPLLEPVNRIEGESDFSQVITGTDIDITARTAVIEIPGDFQAIFDRDKALAQDWRLQSRALFCAYFDAGYAVTDFFHDPEGFEERNFYLLEKDAVIE